MKALIIVDLQNDFMPGGALAVPKGNEIIPIVNRLISRFPLVIATQDWHPKDHMSFASNHSEKKTGDTIDLAGIRQILWPDHCVRHTKGAELVGDLKKESIACIFYKGTDKWVDSYSTFFDNARKRSTGLEKYLKSREIKQVYICGVATDYCVLYSVLDALDLGFEVYVIQDACRGINLNPNDVEKALKEMEEKGAKLVTSNEIEREHVHFMRS